VVWLHVVMSVPCCSTPSADTFFFFFFSSRRRHTRLVSDWSSDVCSSDLSGPAAGRHAVRPGRAEGHRRGGAPARRRRGRLPHPRSEERRVGKGVGLGGGGVIEQKKIGREIAVQV